MIQSRARALATSPAGSGPPWLWLAGITLLAALLRLHQLGDQVVLGDEVHSVKALLSQSYTDVFGHFFRHDICIPLTLLAKLISDTVGLDEISLRIVPLVAGIATVFIVPLLARPWLGNRATIIFSALLATSPMLVFFSRNARPYSVSVLLVAIAVLALVRWMETPSPRLQLVYVLCGIMAIYFHLLSAPAVVTPLLVGLVGSLRPSGRRRAAPRALDYLIMGAGLCCGVGLLLAVPVYTSADVLMEKAFSRPIEPTTAIRALTSMAGVASPWAGGFFWGCVGSGLCIGWFRYRRLTVVLSVTVLVQVAAVLIAHPYGTYIPWILARYNVWLVPFVLLLCAASVNAAEMLPRRWGRWLPSSLGVALCLAVFLDGPIPRIHYAPNNFPNHASFRLFYRAATSPVRVPVPEFYREIAAQEGSFQIVEAPWSWKEPPLYHRFQAVHGKPVLVGFVGRLMEENASHELPLEDPRLRFSRYVDIADIETLASRNVRYVILHPNPPSGGFIRPPTVDVSPVVEYLSERVGRPIIDNQHIVVFDVGSPR